jgi:hypothetical protein
MQIQGFGGVALRIFQIIASTCAARQIRKVYAVSAIVTWLKNAYEC